MGVNWYRITLRLCLGTLRFAGVSDCYTFSAMSPHLEPTFVSLIQSVWIPHTPLPFPEIGLRSPVLFESSTEKLSWLSNISKSFPIKAIHFNRSFLLPERQDVNRWFCNRILRQNAYQLSLFVRALLILLEKDPTDELSFFAIAGQQYPPGFEQMENQNARAPYWNRLGIEKG